MTAVTTPSVAQALARYPVLRDLADVAGGRAWRWIPGADGSLTGTRAWPEGSIDTIVILGETDAAAYRTDGGDEEVFRVSGTLADVVDGLRHVPAPGSPGAPFLALARPPRLIRPRIGDLL